MSNNLDDGCQVVWIHKPSFLSLSRDNQRVIWRFDVYPSIDAGLESSKVYVPKLVKTRIDLYADASTYLILVI